MSYWWDAVRGHRPTRAKHEQQRWQRGYDSKFVRLCRHHWGWFQLFFSFGNYTFARIPPTVGVFRQAQTSGAEGCLILSRAEPSIRHRTPILAVGKFVIDYLKTQKNITLHSIEQCTSLPQSFTTICLFCIFQSNHASRLRSGKSGNAFI